MFFIPGADAMREILITPENIHTQPPALLSDFFQQQTCVTWDANVPYALDSETSLVFSTPVIKRARKNDTQQYRYEFVGAEIGKGMFGSVSAVTGTLAIEANKAVKFKPGVDKKARVIKCENIHENLLMEREAREQRIRNEYHLSMQAKHLAIKPPTMVDVSAGKTSYTVMRKMPGTTLASIVRKEFNGESMLTLQQRIELTQALLQAVKTQVTDLGIIHRDLKCENIIVDLNHPITVNIIDYGLSIKNDNNVYGIAGTPLYLAPESMDKQPFVHTPAADVYSLGRVLSLLWQDFLLVENKLKNWEDLKDNVNNIDKAYLQDNLFKNLNLPSLLKKLVVDAIAPMLHLKPENRATIEECIKNFLHLDKFNHPHGKAIIKILQDIASLNTYQQEFIRNNEVTAAKALTKMTTQLQTALEPLLEMEPEEFQKNLHQVARCQDIIAAQQKAFSTRYDLRCILINIALAIAGLLVIYAALTCINKAVTGNFLFFAAPTAAGKKTVELAQDVDNLENIASTP
ncbi:hypothetical protein ELY10_02105 [Legionella septentrionalis]|nr:hypothetical protein ELY10_02105 [Legionella septentrionalis]